MIDQWKRSSAVVFVLFLVFVVMPFIIPGLYPDFLTTTYKGILQLTSMIYIAGSFACFHYLSREYSEEGTEYLLTREQIQEMTRAVRTTAEMDDQDEKIEKLLALTNGEKGANAPVAKIVSAVAQGLGEESIRLVCKQFIETSAKKPVYLSRYWSQVAATMPLLGMTGTIAGLLFMFSDGNASADKGSQLAGLGVALLTTLYASLLTVLWAKPLAKQQADLVDDIQSYGTDLSNYGQKLTMQVLPHDLENYEIRKREADDPEQQPQ